MRECYLCGLSIEDKARFVEDEDGDSWHADCLRYAKRHRYQS